MRARMLSMAAPAPSSLKWRRRSHPLARNRDADDRRTAKREVHAIEVGEGERRTDARQGPDALEDVVRCGAVRVDEDRMLLALCAARLP
jgi:hypothetical protein